MLLTRRALLQRLSALLVTPLVCGGAAGTANARAAIDDGDDGAPSDDGLPTYTWEGEPGPPDTFAHGVASGDPLPTAVILWTRVSAGSLGNDGVDVFVEIADDLAFTSRIAAMWVRTDADRDYTVHVDAQDLPPGAALYYRFSAVGRTSPVGRTRTAPCGSVDRLRFAVGSCSSYGWGFFHAYRHIAARADLDAVLHVGDYIYEHASAGHPFCYGAVRELDPVHEILTLSDYRRRYAWYRSDPDLQEAHRQHPFINVWDDHEFANDPKIGGADNHTPATEGPWDDRVAAALQAWAEWIPMRMGDGGRIFRSFDYGDLARIVVADRQRRFLWPEPDDGDMCLGAEQAAWVDTQVTTAARWLVLAQQARFTSRSPDCSGDAEWGSASRDRILDAVAGADADAATDLVVLGGDIHRFEALDIVRDPDAYDPVTGEGSEGVELICGSMTSPGGATSADDVPHFHWCESAHRGYLVLDLTADRLVADYFGFPDGAKKVDVLPADAFLAGFSAAHGSRHLVATDEPEPPPLGAPEPA